VSCQKLNLTSAPLLETRETGGEAAGAGERNGALRNGSPLLTPSQRNSQGEAETAPGGAGRDKGRWPDSVPKPDWAIPPDPCPKGGNCQGNCHYCGAQRRWDHPDARVKRQDLNYRQAHTRYNALLQQARTGIWGEWRPTRPPLYRSDFNPDEPWYVAAEAVA
jgi:hypothetical protein